ncbi:hypothetical protein FOCC_FOCC017927 [Frankliniella occidentalis]|nr:hypothetical protein FOCC_FOCC017927 [Frankliniella occidentalis]
MAAPSPPAAAGAQDDDEDRHFCLRCRQTIEGLDEYVLHRRTGCSGPARRAPAAAPLQDDAEGGGLKAADFFSQLELRSSAKVNDGAPSTPGPPAGPAGPRGMLTRSKSSAPRSSPRAQLRPTPRAKAARTARRGVRRAATPLTTEEVDEEDNDSWRYPPKTHTGGKWGPQPPESDPRAPPPSAGGKWGPPPPSHTGGKWRPSSATEQVEQLAEQDDVGPSPQDAQDDSSAQEEEDREECQADKDLHPPPSHTRGKWAPGMANKVRAVLMADAAPARKYGSAVQYWCGSCNRRLASSRLYERHLKSDLHLRRTLPERQLDTGPLPPHHPGRHRSAVRYMHQPQPDHPGESPFREQRIRDGKLEQGHRLGERGQGHRVERCAVCRARVHRHQIGKHLVSHFHWRSTRTTEVGSVAADLILDNIEAVVRQSPFQCGLCKFYCNSSSVFRQHWASEDHRQQDKKVSSESGQYWCSPCEVGCFTTDEMENHLWCDAHREVEAAVNRSVAVVVTRRTSLRCKAIGCHAEFRYNAQLGRHERLHGHEVGPGPGGGWSTASDRYQARFRCADCGALRRSRLALQKHQLKQHAAGAGARGCFYCGVCKLDLFPSAAAAAEHRQTRAHRDAVRDRRERRRARLLARRCPHCRYPCHGLAKLRAHLEDKHPDRKHRCTLCGLAFTLPQEVSQHFRDVHRAAPPSAPAAPADGGSLVPREGEEPPFTCAPCGFATDWRAEMAFHRVLHGPPENPARVEGGAGGGGDVDRTALRYRCPICSKLCRKHALRSHLNVHTGERPFECRHCDKSFSRKDSCVKHELSEHEHQDDPPEDVRDEQERRLQDAISSIASTGGAPSTRPSPGRLPAVASADNFCTSPSMGVGWGVTTAPASGDEPGEPREREHLCDKCGKCFFTKTTLRQHQLSVHGVKPLACSWPGCAIRVRSPAELRAHVETHTGEGEAGAFECQTCHFFAKSKRLLKRHETLHTGEKRFKCEHCDFAARNSCALIRHRRVHTGAKPFCCPHCNYRCNNSENLRKHVLKTNKHPGKCLYECRFCSESSDAGGGDGGVFATNAAADFRSHLARAHAGQFRTLSAAASYVAGIYDKAADPAQTTQTLLDGELFPAMGVDADFPGDVVYVQLVNDDEHIVVLQN